MTPIDVIKIMQSTITNSLVHDAVIKALIAAHPDKAVVRQVAESLLMQQQSRVALTDAAEQMKTNVLDSRAQQSLDSLFREPTVLPPDAD